MIKFDKEKFETFLYFNIRKKSLPLAPEVWENIIAYATDSKWVGNADDAADVVNEESKTFMSIKTAKKSPKILKRDPSYDFTSKPERYDLDNLRIVGRRCGLPMDIDDQKDDPKKVGLAAWKNYKDSELESLKKYSCENTLDIMIVHSMKWNLKEYVVRISGFTHDIPNIEKLNWKANHFGPNSKYKGSRSNVTGYLDDVPVVGRNGGRGGHEQNCFFRYYRATDTLWNIDITIPLPEEEPFDFEKERERMMQRMLENQQ